MTGRARPAAYIRAGLRRPGRTDPAARRRGRRQPPARLAPASRSTPRMTRTWPPGMRPSWPGWPPPSRPAATTRCSLPNPARSSAPRRTFWTCCSAAPATASPSGSCSRPHSPGPPSCRCPQPPARPGHQSCSNAKTGRSSPAPAPKPSPACSPAGGSGSTSRLARPPPPGRLPPDPPQRRPRLQRPRRHPHRPGRPAVLAASRRPARTRRLHHPLTRRTHARPATPPPPAPESQPHTLRALASSDPASAPARASTDLLRRHLRETPLP